MKIINLTELPHYADVISQWHYNEWGKLYPDESQNDFYNELIQSLKEDNISSTWLLLNGNKVIGSASILEIDLITPENFNPWLGNIYILPSYRGKGLGRNFVREVMKKIQDSGIENLYLYTEDKTHVL